MPLQIPTTTASTRLIIYRDKATTIVTPPPSLPRACIYSPPQLPNILSDYNVFCVLCSLSLLVLYIKSSLKLSAYSTFFPRHHLSCFHYFCHPCKFFLPYIFIVSILSYFRISYFLSVNISFGKHHTNIKLTPVNKNT